MKQFWTTILFAAVAAFVPNEAQSQTLELKPPVCRIFTNSNVCQTIVSWTTPWPHAEIWLTDYPTGANPRGMAAGASGQAAAAWIREYPGVNFNLKNLTTGTFVLTKHAYGTRILKGGTNIAWYNVDPAWVYPASGTPYFGAFQSYIILKNYHLPGVRAQVQSQLSSIYASGARILRIFIWHARNNNSGIVFDSSHKPGQPNIHYYPTQIYTNLQTFLTDIGDAGFQHIHAAMGPLGTNNYHHNCGTLTAAQLQSILDENYGMLRETHLALAASGLGFLIDIQNEYVPYNGAASCRFTGLKQTWERYVQEFGAQNSVGASVIVSSAWDVNNRFVNLPEIYANAAPAKFELHTYESDALLLTQMFEQAMNLQKNFPAHLRNVPWVIGEAYYNHSATADGFKTAIINTGAPIDYIIQWPTYIDSQGQKIVVKPTSFSVYASAGF